MITDKGQVYSPKVKVLAGVSRYLIPLTLWEGGKGEGFSVIFFHTLKTQHILFWLAINAKLACKRCPFDL